VSRRRRTTAESEQPIHRGPSPRWRARRVFYIAVEGEETEPDYLDYLNAEFGDEHGFYIHVLAKKGGYKPLPAVNAALAYQGDVEDHDKDETADPALRPQLWAMFDHDTHVQIREAFSLAEREGLKIAFSHPSFDLWLLLHFSDFQSSQSGSSTIVVEKLRGADPVFARYATRSGEKKLDEPRINALRGNHSQAAKRAQRLSDDCRTGVCSRRAGHASHCQPASRDPSTDVWRLLAALGIL
jgi:hypothetical protein